MNKKHLLWAILILSGYNALRAESPPRDWGAETNHVRISIEVKSSPKELKVGKPLELIAAVTNASSDNIKFYHSSVANRNPSWSFLIISPSGKTESPNTIPGHRLGHGAFVTATTNSVTECEFPIGDLWKPSEIGTYRIRATIEMTTNLNEKTAAFRATSNTIELKVVP